MLLFCCFFLDFCKDFFCCICFIKILYSKIKVINRIDEIKMGCNVRFIFRNKFVLIFVEKVRIRMKYMKYS